MSQKLIFCSDSKCPRFFVDTKEEREKAMNNGWNLKAEGDNICSKHQYRLFAELGAK